MKITHNVALVIAGTLLIALPILHTMFLEYQLVSLMKQTQQPANLNSSLSSTYGWWCLGIGASMIGVTLLPLLAQSEAQGAGNRQVTGSS
ncbi:hypothetical protein [Cerasicoccus fimbriatus]|uniref:hypothetical protein n=1 Tax=Cerasicoccus fimbriatus TaxID=3014554 RepID=UPI0022B362D6|nr:hypothetical protein [Cerasicoccus sp. TK19100]